MPVVPSAIAEMGEGVFSGAWPRYGGTGASGAGPRRGGTGAGGARPRRVGEGGAPPHQMVAGGRPVRDKLGSRRGYISERRLQPAGAAQKLAAQGFAGTARGKPRLTRASMAAGEFARN